MLKSRSFQYYAFAHDCIRCVTIVGCWQLRLFISLVTNCQSFEPLSLANLCVFDKISQCPQNILIHTRASNWPKKFASKPRAHSSAKFLVKFIGLIKFNLLSRCTEFRWVFFRHFLSCWFSRLRECSFNGSKQKVRGIKYNVFKLNVNIWTIFRWAFDNKTFPLTFTAQFRVHGFKFFYHGFSSDLIISF